MRISRKLAAAGVAGVVGLGGLGAVLVAARALAATSAMVLLAATTPMVDLLAGLRRARVPEVREPVSGTGAASLAREGRVLLVLHEDAADGLGALPEAAWAGAEEIAVLVGPEGGISPAELDACRDAGAHPVRLGPHVLRASTAGAAALAVLEHRLGRW